MPKRKKNRKHSAHVPTLKPMNAAARTALMIDRQPDINAGVCIDCHEAEPVEGHHRCLPCFEASYHRAPRPKKHKKRAVPTPIPRVSFFEYAGVRVAIPHVRGKSVRELPVYVEGKRVGAFTAFDTAALGYPPRADKLKRKLDANRERKSEGERWVEPDARLRVLYGLAPRYESVIAAARALRGVRPC